jgi:hypothetical protein
VSGLHLTKVALGCRDLPALQSRIAGRVDGGVVRVATRFRPKRAEELIGGSLFWIVRHRLVACQPILRFDDREDGRVDIVCGPELTVVAPRYLRAHQGWRYLDEDAAPGDEDDGSGLGSLPPVLLGRLTALALV